MMIFKISSFVTAVLLNLSINQTLLHFSSIEPPFFGYSRIILVIPINTAKKMGIL